MLAVVVLGLPRSATTRLYKRLYSCLRDYGVIGVFEPFNHEVVSDMVIRGTHSHDKEGVVPHDYGSLPRELAGSILDNSLYHHEWCSTDKPSKPFLGDRFLEIMGSLDSLDKPVLMKDVVAWVRAGELVTRYPHTLFIFTLPDSATWEHRMYKRMRVVPSPLNKAGISTFTRYLTRGYHIPYTSPESVSLEARLVYYAYRVIVESIRRHGNVYVLDYYGWIDDKKEDEIIHVAKKWLLRLLQHE